MLKYYIEKIFHGIFQHIGLVRHICSQIEPILYLQITVYFSHEGQNRKTHIWGEKNTGYHNNVIIVYGDAITLFAYAKVNGEKNQRYFFAGSMGKFTATFETN